MYESDLLDCIELSGFSIPELDCIWRRHVEEYDFSVDVLVACLIFRATSTPFDDPKVRRAFAHAVDIEKLAREILHGYEQPAVGGVFPPGFPGHAPGIVLPHDPEQAQALLAEAGYPAGRGFPAVEFLAPGASGAPGAMRRSGFNIPIVQYLVDQWRQVLKVEVNAQVLTFPAFREQLLKSPPDIRLAIWEPDYPDPDCFLGQICSLDFWHDLRYEQLIARARVEVNHSPRMALYHAAHQRLLTEAAIVPLVYPAGQYLLKPWFRYGFAGRYWQDFVLLPH
jgi:ABC-type transport system substrate-binding protein